MEITADGYRCFRCSQAAAIDQHHANVKEQLASHNRSVIAMGGFRFWNLEFHCTHCNEEIDGSPRLFSVKLPPARIACGKCGQEFGVTFWHGARWIYSVVAKLAFLAVVAIRYADLRAAIPKGAADILAQVAMSFGIALAIATVLTIPVALVTGRKKPAA
jgi:hypothetical protein